MLRLQRYAEPSRHRSDPPPLWLCRPNSLPLWSLVVPAPTAAPSARPLTGTQITIPQRRVPVASHLPQPESLLEILNRLSHKRSTVPSLQLPSLSNSNPFNLCDGFELLLCPSPPTPPPNCFHSVILISSLYSRTFSQRAPTKCLLVQSRRQCSSSAPDLTSDIV